MEHDSNRGESGFECACTYLHRSHLGLGTDVLLGAATSRNSTHTSSGGHIHLGGTEDSHCLMDLREQSLWTLQQVDQISVVHLQEHSGEL